MVRDLRSRVIGRRISDCLTYWDRIISYPSAEEFPSRLRGRRVESVTRRGKYAILELDFGVQLGIHRGMSGSLLHRSTDTPMEKHVRALFQLDDGTQLRFDDARKFGRLFAVTRSDSATAPWLKLGPEPFDEALDTDRFMGLFVNRSGSVKTLLLNQKILAGVGNIYADEALFMAGIRPTRRVNTVSRARMGRLLEAIRDALTQGIQNRGTTFTSYRDIEGDPGLNLPSLRVFGRTGEQCPKCQGRIKKIVLNGRGTHYCPRCQT